MISLKTRIKPIDIEKVQICPDIFIPFKSLTYFKSVFNVYIF